MGYSPTAVLAKIIEETVPDLRLKSAVLLDYLGSKGCVKKGTHTDMYWNAIATGSQTATSAMSVAGTDQATGLEPLGRYHSPSFSIALEP